MLSNNIPIYTLRILAEIGKDLIYFPIWWYSQGLFLFTKKLLLFLASQEKAWGLIIWIKNIFKPMYAQSDWQGRLISFFMRIVQILFRLMLMIFWLLFCLSALSIWLILPFFVLYQIYFQLFL